MKRSLLALALLSVAFTASAQNLLIRNAKVVAGGNAAPRDADVLIRNGVIQSVGNGLSSSGVTVVDANGRFVTPMLFGGISDIGVEEVSGERSTVDSSFAHGNTREQMEIRPEFDVTLAFNPDSILIPVARNEGIGWTLVSAGSSGVSSIVLGQGGVVRFNGDTEAIGPRALFLNMGEAGASASGNSRAAQWMILDQLIDEVQGKIGPDSRFALLTPAGRKAFSKYLAGNGRVFVGMNRASDIRQLLKWSARTGVKVAIVGGDEGWKVANDLARAKVPVFINALNALPSNFDSLGTRLDNAALLNQAGVPVSFYQSDMASHMAFKMRQIAGNAVSYGMPWQAAFAGLTTVPAQAMGVADKVGSIAAGHPGDVVIWSGDPLEVNAIADQVIVNGRVVDMRSRHTELRDRYLKPTPNPDQGQMPRAYE